MGKWPGQRRRLVAALGTAAALVLAGAMPTAARAAAGRPTAPARTVRTVASTAAGDLLAAGGPRGRLTPEQPADTHCSAAFYNGDFRLGPAHLATAGPVAELLRGYDRLGGMTSSAFLGTFWNTSKKDWNYPPQEGYVLNEFNKAQKFIVRMTPGLRMDRFGRESGGFLSPYGQPFDLRALAPWSLDGPDCGYHAYLVLREFRVEAGPVARWFRQPGYGFQYVLSPVLVPHSPAKLSVRWLVNHGYLRRLTP